MQTHIANADENRPEQLSGWALAGDVIREQSSTAWPEIKGIAKAPFENPKESVKWGLFIAGLVAVDKSVTQYYQLHVEPSIQYSLPELSNSPILRGSDGYLVLGVTSQYLGGLVMKNRKAQETSIMAGKAMAYSYLFAQLIGKSITGRNRPVSDISTCSGDPPPFTCDPYDFGHFHPPSFSSDAYGTAMPSFHFTMYFAVARVYARSYDNYWVPYTIAAGLLGSNIEGHQHWVSDMVAGGLLGTFIGNRIVDSYQNRVKKGKLQSKWDVYPFAVSSGMGVYLTKSL